ncbi:MAG: P-II family nitrogen regulator [Planctomycetota bacterium]
MFHPAAKLTIITEHFLSAQVCAILEAGGAKGYTLVSVGGKGLHHLHSMSDQATVVEGFDNVKIEVVLADRATAERIAKRVLDECFADNPGIMFLDAVEVCRSERF